MLFTRLARSMLLADVLQVLRESCGAYELVAHWCQGEFHHDIVIRLPLEARRACQAPGSVLVVSTNCNGGVKELLWFDEVPDRYGLWHHRCPDNREFGGRMPPIRAQLRTSHWFDPCQLLAADARSELRPEFRRRQRGGGWEKL